MSSTQLSQHRALLVLLAAVLAAGFLLARLVTFGQEEPTDADRQRFIVTLHPNQDPGLFADELTSEGVRVQTTFTHALTAVVAVGTTQQREELQADPRVAHIETFDGYDAIPALTNQPVMDGPLPDDQPILYVLDSPIETDPDWFKNEHAELTVVQGFGAYVERRKDCPSHGTKVAGIAAGDMGVARQVTVVPVAIHCGGRTDPEALLGGLDWIVANHPEGTPAVLNMSMTIRHHDAYSQAFRAVNERGILQVWAAGNAGDDACSGLRAEFRDEVVIVGSVDRGFERPGTNYGRCIDVFAQGDHVRTASATGQPLHFAGTSAATPLVAGVLLSHLQDDPKLDAGDLIGRLYAAAETGKVKNAGAGSPDRYVHAGVAPRHADRQKSHAATSSTVGWTGKKTVSRQVRPPTR